MRISDWSSDVCSTDLLVLVDSGAQYLDGTTDVTRTVAIGKASTEQRDRFTRVLKGHIGIATARFPEGTSGSQLDALARMRSEEHTSELQSLMRISYAVFCLKKKNKEENSRQQTK